MRARVTIAGDGPMKDRLIALAALYAESHVFLHPSEMPPDQNQKGVPNFMLEAMATGLPVVATTHGGIPEAVAHDRTGLLVPERNAEALSAALFAIPADAARWSQLGAAAAESMREEFEQGRALEKLESFYDEARALSHLL